MTKRKGIAIGSSIILGIIIGLLGEIMPDVIKSSFVDFCNETLQLNPTFIWTLLIILTTSFLIFISLKVETMSNDNNNFFIKTTIKKQNHKGKGDNVGTKIVNPNNSNSHSNFTSEFDTSIEVQKHEGSGDNVGTKVVN